MSNVTDLADYVSQREVLSSTAIVFQKENMTNWAQVTQKVSSGGGMLSAGVLQKLNPENEVGRFLDLCAQALAQIEECKELIKSDPLAADDKFMASKVIFSELLMFRDLSDSVGLISAKCFQVASQVAAVTDAPELPAALIVALTRIWAAPFMAFSEACNLADEIEQAAPKLVLPSYDEVAAELVSDAEQSEVVAE